MLGTIWHAAWAGIPLGLCVIAFIPIPWRLRHDRGTLVGKFVTHARQAGALLGASPRIASDPERRSTVTWPTSTRAIIIISGSSNQESGRRPEQADHRARQPRTTATYIARPPRAGRLRRMNISTGSISHRVAKAKAKDARQGREARQSRTEDPLLRRRGLHLPPISPELKYPGTTRRRGRDRPRDHPRERDGPRAQGKAKSATPTSIRPGETPAPSSSAIRARIATSLIFGDAFNDFSVPWHMTTREFNDKVAEHARTDKGVYMINIIDVYDVGREGRRAESTRRRRSRSSTGPDGRREGADPARAEHREGDDTYTGFLGAWVETARKSFKHVDDLRDSTTRPAAASARRSSSWSPTRAAGPRRDLGSRDDDPEVLLSRQGCLFEPKPFGRADHVKADRRAVEGDHPHRRLCPGRQPARPPWPIDPRDRHR